MPPFPSATKTWHSTTYASLSPTRPELSAKGKTVVITGGGTGIGAETARYFAEAGASRIALLGRREQPLLDTRFSIENNHAGVNIFTASTDITNKSAVDTAFANFVGGGGGKIDVMVSNAAVTGPLAEIDNVDAALFMEGVNTNLSGNLHVAQAFLRYAAKDAVVIDVSSLAAHADVTSLVGSYCVAKMAVVRLWDHVAFLHPEMRIYHMQPGVVDTDMNKAAGGVKGIGYEDHVSLPASFNLWLTSPEANFLKGKFLYSNWDVEELKSRAKEIGESHQFSVGLVGWPFGDSSWKPTWKF